jgi:hypothetical protein
MCFAMSGTNVTVVACSSSIAMSQKRMSPSYSRWVVFFLSYHLYLPSCTVVHRSTLFLRKTSFVRPFLYFSCLTWITCLFFFTGSSQNGSPRYLPKGHLHPGGPGTAKKAASHQEFPHHGQVLQCHCEHSQVRVSLYLSSCVPFFSN